MCYIGAILVVRLQVNVDVADAGPERGRIVVANRTMRRGDLLAAVPVDICFNPQGLQANTDWKVRVCL